MSRVQRWEAGPGPAHGPRELALQGRSSAVPSLCPKDATVFLKEKLRSDSAVVSLVAEHGL